jgi:hypothetical protein
MNIIIQDTDTETHKGLAAYLRQRSIEISDFTFLNKDLFYFKYVTDR